MTMVEEKILTIEKIVLSGKYVEFFFEEEKEYTPTWDDTYTVETGKEERYLECCKQTHLFEIIDFELILNTGLRGKKSKWVLNEHKHYILESIQP